MDFLTVVTPEGDSYRQDLGATGLRIGRASVNDLILKDPNVSRMHAEIVRRSGGFYVLDAGGKNGTFLNDRRIGEPTMLRPGDRVRVGTTVLIFNGAPAGRVEWDDRPLLPGGGTTILPASALHTPSSSGVPAGVAETPSSARTDSPPARDLDIFMHADGGSPSGSCASTSRS